jgi:hypothetical protein
MRTLSRRCTRQWLDQHIGTSDVPGLKARIGIVVIAGQVLGVPGDDPTSTDSMKD